MTEFVVTDSKPHHYYLDRQRQYWMVQVSQGNYHVTSDPNVVLHTVLGSCIAACIRDPDIGFGGMNHFLLPASASPTASSDDMLAARYGNHAMELLINGILSRGGRRDRLEIKVFGGGNVVRNILGIGHKNAAFIEEWLATERLKIAAHDLRGYAARRVEYHPITGRVRMQLITDDRVRDVFTEESRRAPRVTESVAGDIELFD